MKSLFLAMCCALFCACGVKPQHNAQIDHVWGQTRRIHDYRSAAVVCESRNSENPHAVKLRAVAERIAKANPSTFSDPFDVSKLCLWVNPKIDGLDARTTPESMRIDFSPQLMDLFASDDELAAVLSHELAHVTLQHQGFGETPPRMVNDPMVLEWQLAGRKIQAEIVALAKAKADPEKIFALNAEFAKILKKVNKRIDDVYGEENAHLNWLEQEADEVGAEFFVRAGYDRRAFVNILWTSRAATSEERMACSELIDSALRDPHNAKRPSRGNKSHPSTCWRVYHLTVDEWAHAHAGELAKLDSM